MSNKAVLDKGMAKGRKIIEDHLMSELFGKCVALLKLVALMREYKGFTGQTQTSYMGALYLNGELWVMFNQRNWFAPPKRKKVKFGEYVFLEDPYEPPARGGRGAVEIQDPDGESLSTKILKSYKAPKKGFALVITTGTEYSEYLELNGIDVLTKTFSYAPNMVLNKWKKVGD